LFYTHPNSKSQKKRDEYTFAEQKPPEGQAPTHPNSKSQKKRDEYTFAEQKPPERDKHLLIPIQKVRKKRDEYTFAEQKPPEGQALTHPNSKSQKKKG
jgi:transcription initiation factor IIF auxiliary subunit